MDDYQERSNNFLARVIPCNVYHLSPPLPSLDVSITRRWDPGCLNPPLSLSFPSPYLSLSLPFFPADSLCRSTNSFDQGTLSTSTTQLLWKSPRLFHIHGIERWAINKLFQCKHINLLLKTASVTWLSQSFGWSLQLSTYWGPLPLPLTLRAPILSHQFYPLSSNRLLLKLR